MLCLEVTEEKRKEEKIIMRESKEKLERKLEESSTGIQTSEENFILNFPFLFLLLSNFQTKADQKKKIQTKH